MGVTVLRVILIRYYFQIIPFNLHDYGLVLADFITRLDQQLENIGVSKAIGTKAYRLVLNNLFGALKRFQVVADVIEEIKQV